MPALWRRWQNSGWASPSGKITEAEAVERVRQYAEANNLTFREPLNTHLEKRLVDDADRDAGMRTIYVMALGTFRPMPFVEVDAADGTVVAWRQLSR